MNQDKYSIIDKCDIGVVGLAVMGRNLALNFSDKGFGAAVYDEAVSAVDELLRDDAAIGRSNIVGTYSLKQFCDCLSRPRKILLVIKAGDAVDEVIGEMLPFLESGDCIVDGGNSFFKDTARRCQYLKDKGIIFCGAGISGGGEGARRGPSIMPGGNPQAWQVIRDIFQSICARTSAGIPCCDWIGDDGAGHYAKMVHNGIEYGDMQLVSEAYSLLKNTLEMEHDEMAELFDRWSRTELDSYLIRITADILRYKDGDGKPLVEKILDCAGQKGTGKWMSANSLELGTPATLATEAVYARMVSAMVDERRIASSIFGDKNIADIDDIRDINYAITGKQKEEMAEDIRKALLASKIISYAQGFMLLSSASKEYSWNLDLGNIALLWREGCIIRSVFLDDIHNAFRKNPNLQNLLFDDNFSRMIINCQSSWRKTVSTAITSGIAVPAFSSALGFYDSYRCERSPANLIQAQRDYFGAHACERVDRPRGEFFHTDWTGAGGNAVSGVYSV